MKKYRHHKYTWIKQFNSVRHNWEFVGPRGGVNFHVSITDGYGETAGLEFHHFSGDGAPDHVNCPLTGGHCWHDGTSLYASETLWPMIKPILQSGDHETIFRFLEQEADRRFDGIEKVTVK